MLCDSKFVERTCFDCGSELFDLKRFKCPECSNNDERASLFGSQFVLLMNEISIRTIHDWIRAGTVRSEREIEITVSMYSDPNDEKSFTVFAQKDKKRKIELNAITRSMEAWFGKKTFRANRGPMIDQVRAMQYHERINILGETMPRS